MLGLGLVASCLRSDASGSSRRAAYAFALLSLALAGSAGAVQIDIPGPEGSIEFGTSVTVLPNGNFVVTDPAAQINIGAVYLYSADGTLISTLTGSVYDDRIGSDGVTVLGNGNYVIRSSHWQNGGEYDAGAVTWGSATAGVSGVVSSSNSLVGTASGDEVGSTEISLVGVTNYVFCNPSWNNGMVANVGAVTWGNGTTGSSGAVSAANSLIGTAAGDSVGNLGITVLGNGNYLVGSNWWDNGAVPDAGAVTWGSGVTGITGPVSSVNSLVGSTESDRIGSSNLVTSHIVALSNGNYVVGSPEWDGVDALDAGAATWGDGTVGISGVVSASNSLVGASAFDEVGLNGGGSTTGITPLANGNYVVAASRWDNGALKDVGAVVWADGSLGKTGVITAADALVGTQAGDAVGHAVVPLTNGNYVVSSLFWRNASVAGAGAATWRDGSQNAPGVVALSNSLVGTQNGQGAYVARALNNGNYVVVSEWSNGSAFYAGAVTWANGATGTTGLISAANSLVGSTFADYVGYGGITALENGNYVVSSPRWNTGPTPSRGAVTLGNGAVGTVGVVSSSNSLVGTTDFDQVSSLGVVALRNGNYVVSSPYWRNGAAERAGAVTWGSGIWGVVGAVSASNSLVGSAYFDEIGSVNSASSGITPLADGDFVVGSPSWDNGALSNAGAITWGDGSSGPSGLVSVANSWVGLTAGDVLGTERAIDLGNGSYVFRNPYWNNGSINGAGAITLERGTDAGSGVIDSTNSVLGTTEFGGIWMVFDYDPNRDTLVVGRPHSNIVTIFRADRLFRDGFE